MQARGVVLVGAARDACQVISRRKLGQADSTQLAKQSVPISTLSGGEQSQLRLTGT